jgi:hypothetical protein
VECSLLKSQSKIHRLKSDQYAPAIDGSGHHLSS